MAIINRAAWAPEEHEEYDALLRDVVMVTINSSEQLDLYERFINDAIQAHRPWAREVARCLLRHGAGNEIRRYQNRQRTHAMVSADGRVLNLPAIQGTTLRNDDGEEVYQRELIELWAWEQIVEKRAKAIRTRRVYTDKIAHYDRLLALRELCPDSTSPNDAAERLGITVDSFLASADDENAA